MNDLIAVFGIQTTEQTIAFLNRSVPKEQKKRKRKKNK